MTRFWRNGFYRTSPLGDTHWVEGHWVERDDWDRYGNYGYSTYANDQLTTLRANGSATACFVNPNAKCPVCGQDVFFYQNEYGSRVFFDELGPPWPKHPCTDNERFQKAAKSRSGRNISPVLRSPGGVSEIKSWLESAGLNPEDEFSWKYETKQWDCWKVEDRRRGDRNSLLILSSVGEGKERMMYLASKRIPRSVNKNTFIFYHRGRVGYFNNSEMTSAEIQARRLSGSSEFVRELIGQIEDDN